MSSANGHRPVDEQPEEAPRAAQTLREALAMIERLEAHGAEVGECVVAFRVRTPGTEKPVAHTSAGSPLLLTALARWLSEKVAEEAAWSWSRLGELFRSAKTEDTQRWR